MAAPGTTSHITEILTLEAFEAKMLAERAERERRGIFRPGKTRNVLKPAAVGGSRAVEPVAIGKPRSSEHVVQLYRLATAHRFAQPVFEFSETGIHGGPTFGVKLKLCYQREVEVDGRLEVQDMVREVEDDGPYQSKKEAKEGVAGRGLDVIKQVVSEASNTKDGFFPATTRDTGVPAVPEERYVALLHDYCSHSSLPQPSYQLYQATPTSFACEVTLQIPPPDPSSPPNTHDTPASATTEPEQHTFGTRTRSSSSKKAAKSAAAKAAVAHLRASGLLPGQGGPPLRKKARTHSRTDISSGSSNDNDNDAAGEIETIIPGLTTLRRVGGGGGGGSAPVLADASSANVSRVHELRQHLCLGNMEYRLSVAAPGTSFYNGAAHFPGETRRSGLQGPLGEVRAVFGKKAAKEEVAREVVKILEALLEERLSGVK